MSGGPALLDRLSHARVAPRARRDVWNASASMKHFGARLDFDAGRSRARRDRSGAGRPPRRARHRGGERRRARRALRPRHRHGRLAVRPDTRSATVTLAMTFLRPTRGDRVVAEARLIRSGLNLIFAAAEIFDGEGKVTARCDGTCAIALGKTDSTRSTKRMRPGGRPSLSAPSASRRPPELSPRALDRLGGLLGRRVHVVPVPLLDRLAHRRQRLDAVAGVGPGRVD